uniref:Coat protein n=1 Tax=Pistacia ribo-like virus TaxID=2794234 RepID=A0A7T0Q6Z9_9VIRU|nr:coat protein [Pistacia ribo-like virus]
MNIDRLLNSSKRIEDLDKIRTRSGAAYEKESPTELGRGKGKGGNKRISPKKTKSPAKTRTEQHTSTSTDTTEILDISVQEELFTERVSNSEHSSNMAPQYNKVGGGKPALATFTKGFVDYRRFRLMLDTLKTINFSIVAERNSAISIIKELEIDYNLVGRNIRFPTPGTYVMINGYNQQLTRLVSCLSWRYGKGKFNAEVGSSSSNDRDLNVTTTESTRADMNAALGNDPSLAYYKIIESLVSEISQGKHVYEQEEFEEVNNIVWTP